jgi:hypothetical protein
VADDPSSVAFEEFLKRREWRYEAREVPGGRAFVVPDYEIPYGPHAGRRIALGFVLPADYPSTPPSGVQVPRDHGLSESPMAVYPSPLGPDWQHWSRRVQGWEPGDRCARRFLDQVERWLETA